jgi:hypothetical protein
LMVGGSAAPRIETDEPGGAGPPGSGNWGTPCVLMHLANVTAPWPGPEPVCADATGPAPEPHAASASMAAQAAGAASNLKERMSAVLRTAG